MPGIYLCSRKDRYDNFDIVYNDIDARYLNDLTSSKRIVADCNFINYLDYDFIIATPPCNYYSRANYRRETSKYAQDTKHLLPTILNTCTDFDVPFIVENVLNDSLLPHQYDKYCRVFDFGGHRFWTNVIFDISDLVPVKQNKQNVCRNKRDGNANVHMVIERFLASIHKPYEMLIRLVRCGIYVP